MLNVSVIVCTLNRCESLARALDSVAALTVPGSVEWEVLVVDNGSTDGTRGVVEDFSLRYPGRFRHLYEPRPGKSHALNRGVAESRGEVLAFTDDDVTVETQWLWNLTAGVCRGECSGAAGRILPSRHFVPPSWLALDGPRSLAPALYPRYDRGDVPGELPDPPYGANMAFRKEMFQRYGHFRTALGPFPDRKVGFEDMDFGRRLMEGGESLRYIPAAIVYHEIDEKRVRKDCILTWWFNTGRGFVRFTGMGPLETLKVVARIMLMTPFWLLTVNSQRRFYRKCRTWYNVGKLYEVYRQVRAATEPGTQ